MLLEPGQPAPGQAVASSMTHLPTPGSSSHAAESAQLLNAHSSEAAKSQLAVSTTSQPNNQNQVNSAAPEDGIAAMQIDQSTQPSDQSPHSRRNQIPNRPSSPFAALAGRSFSASGAMSGSFPHDAPFSSTGAAQLAKLKGLGSDGRRLQSTDSLPSCNDRLADVQQVDCGDTSSNESEPGADCGDLQVPMDPMQVEHDIATGPLGPDPHLRKTAASPVAAFQLPAISECFLPVFVSRMPSSLIVPSSAIASWAHLNIARSLFLLNSRKLTDV